MSLPALPLGGRGLWREPQPGRTDPGVSCPSCPPSVRPHCVRPGLQAASAAVLTGCSRHGRRAAHGSRLLEPLAGGFPRLRPAVPGQRSPALLPGGAWGRPPEATSRAAGRRVPGGEQNGRSVLPPGPRGLQEELLTRQCGQPVTLALSALQSRAQVRGPRDSGRELFTFFGCCLVFLVSRNK